MKKILRKTMTVGLVYLVLIMFTFVLTERVEKLDKTTTNNVTISLNK